MVSKVWRKIMLALVICLGVFAAVSCSDNNGGGDSGDRDVILDDSIRRIAAYVVIDNMWANPKVGIIKGNKDVDNISIELIVPSIPDDPKQAMIHSYGNRPKDGDATIVLQRYDYSRAGNPGASVFSTFAANGDINESTISQNVTDWGGTIDVTDNYAANVRNMVRVGDYLYIISYDYPRVSKVNLITGSLVSSVEMPKIDGKPTNGQDIITVNNRVFVLFTAATNTSSTTPEKADYSDSVVVELIHTDSDAAPVYGEQVRVGKNAVNMVPAGNYIYVPAIGGPQQTDVSNGNNSNISRITLENDGSLSSEVVYYGTDNDYDIHGVAVGKEETLVVRVQMTLYSMATKMKLSKIKTADFHVLANTSIETLTDHIELHTDPDEDYSDILYGLDYTITYDETFDQFWMYVGGPLKIYSGDLSDLKEFTFEDLYGARAAYMSSFTLFTGELGSSKTFGGFSLPSAARTGGLFNIKDPELLK